MSGGFLSRWSRRKLAAVAQAEAVVPVAGESPAPLRSEAADPLSVVPAAPDGAASAEMLAGAAAEAGLPPVESLSLSSDFTAFLKDEVVEALRRKALHKLFSDPHFNQMDGLDIYIDDYSISEPIPEAMMATLNQAKTLFGEPESATETPPEALAESTLPAPDAPAELPENVSDHCDNLSMRGQNVPLADAGENPPG